MAARSVMIKLRVFHRARKIVETLRKFLPAIRREVVRILRALGAFAQHVAELLVVQLGAADAEHLKAGSQQAIGHEVEKRGDQLAAAEIAGRAKDDNNAGLDRFLTGRLGNVIDGDFNTAHRPRPNCGKLNF